MYLELSAIHNSSVRCTPSIITDSRLSISLSMTFESSLITKLDCLRYPFTIFFFSLKFSHSSGVSYLIIVLITCL